MKTGKTPAAAALGLLGLGATLAACSSPGTTASAVVYAAGASSVAAARDTCSMLDTATAG